MPSRIFPSRSLIIGPLLELAAGEPPERFDVFLARALDDLVGQRGDRRLLVPADALEIIADELLVEAGLGAAGLVSVRRPETGRVGRQHLVDQDDSLLGLTS